MKDYKEIKINEIEDLRIGDITFTSDGHAGTVIEIGETLLHKHSFVKVLFVVKYPGYNSSYIEKKKLIYNEWFKDSEIILRQVYDVILGLGEQE